MNQYFCLCLSKLNRTKKHNGCVKKKAPNCNSFNICIGIDFMKKCTLFIYRTRFGQVSSSGPGRFQTVHMYPWTPDSSEGLIPRVIICNIRIDPYVLFSFKSGVIPQGTKLNMGTKCNNSPQPSPINSLF